MKLGRLTKLGALTEDLKVKTKTKQQKPAVTAARDEEEETTGTAWGASGAAASTDVANDPKQQQHLPPDQPNMHPAATQGGFIVASKFQQPRVQNHQDPFYGQRRMMGKGPHQTAANGQGNKS